MKYVEKILQSKEESAKALAPARSKEQAAALGIAVAKLDLEVQTARGKLEVLKSGYPLDIESIIDAQNTVALQERKLSQLAALNAELFG